MSQQRRNWDLEWQKSNGGGKRRKRCERCEEESFLLSQANLKPAMWCWKLSRSTWISSWWFWIIHTSHYKGNQASSLFFLLSLTVICFLSLFLVYTCAHTRRKGKQSDKAMALFRLEIKWHLSWSCQESDYGHNALSLGFNRYYSCQASEIPK